MNKTEYRAINRLAEHKPIILFDCFDTLFERVDSISQPFFLLADWLVQEFGVEQHNDQTLSPLAQSLRLFFRADLGAETSFRNIFYHYIDEQKWDCSSFVKKAMDFFWRHEAANIRPTRYAEELLSRLGEERIAIVSDFYFGSRYLKELFVEHFHIAGIPLFVSCDYKTSKADRLYDVVLQAFRAEDCLMVGDNYKFDFVIPASRGIMSFCVDSRCAMKRYRSFNERYEALQIERCLPLWNHDSVTYSSNYAFLLFLFFKRLYSRLDNHDVVHFLAREGQFLKAAFDQYLAFHNDKGIKTKYVYVSRLAAFISSFDNTVSTAEEFASGFKRHTEWRPKSIGQFLAFLGLEPIEAKNICDHANISGDDPVLGDFFTASSFLILWDDSVFRDIFTRIHAATNDALQEQLSETNAGKLILADIGWGGRMQNVIKSLCPDNNVIGYYLALYYSVGELPGSSKIGLLNDYCRHPGSLDPDIGSITVCEALLRADHGQAVCCGEDGNWRFYNDSGPIVFRDYARQRQILMKDTLTELCRIDQVTPLSEKVLVKFANLALKKKPYKANVCDLYYNSAQFYSTSVLTGPVFHSLLYRFGFWLYRKSRRLLARILRLFRRH